MYYKLYLQPQAPPSLVFPSPFPSFFSPLSFSSIFIPWFCSLWHLLQDTVQQLTITNSSLFKTNTSLFITNISLITKRISSSPCLLWVSTAHFQMCIKKKNRCRKVIQLGFEVTLGLRIWGVTFLLLKPHLFHPSNGQMVWVCLLFGIVCELNGLTE